jgi:hypothetical protein
MLEQVDAAHFTPFTGKMCDLRLADGSILPMLIDCVTCKPLARNPYAAETQRLPFSVTLTATRATDFIEGPCSIELDNFGRLEGVYVSRVASLGRDPNGAYYQIVFN